MTENSNQYPMRVVIPVVVGVLIGMTVGKSVGTALTPSIGYWGALLVNMLAAAVVSVLVVMPLVYCFTGRQPKN
jgi:threonine/homoserine efflux transporter RhtA